MTDWYKKPWLAFDNFLEINIINQPLNEQSRWIVHPIMEQKKWCM